MQKSLTKKETMFVLGIIAAGTVLLVAAAQSASVIVVASLSYHQDVGKYLPSFSNTSIVDTDSMKKTYYNLDIPALNIHQPVGRVSNSYWLQKQWDELEQVMQGAMVEYGVVAYPNSVEPGSKGSLYLTGHSSAPSPSQVNDPYTSLFKHLPSLVQGDEITITMPNETLTYQVESFKIVSANNTDILKQNYDNELLVLITCYPIGSTKDRFVVTARRSS